MKNKRESNIELLRIIAMLMIVMHHAIVHGMLNIGIPGVMLKYYPSLSLSVFSSHFSNITIANILIIGGKIGVDIFILITGYFMIKSRISVKKTVKLWFPIFIYSVLGLLVGLLTQSNNIDLRSVITSFFPISFVEYWFMTVYVCLYLSIPILNHLWLNIDNYNKIRIVLFLFIGISVAPLFFKNMSIYCDYMLFVLLYFIGALCRDFHLIDNSKKLRRYGLSLSLIMFLVYILSVLSFELIGIHRNSVFFLNHSLFFANDNSPLTLAIALGMFIFFGSIKIKYNRIINWIASTTFAIYIIHENNFIRPLIWNRIFHMQRLINLSWYNMLLRYVATICCVYLSCILIESVRRLLFSKFDDKIEATLINFLIKIKNAVDSYLNLKLKS